MLINRRSLDHTARVHYCTFPPHPILQKLLHEAGIIFLVVWLFSFLLDIGVAADAKHDRMSFNQRTFDIKTTVRDLSAKHILSI